MLTDFPYSRRRRRSPPGGVTRSMSQSDAQLYRDLAQASGGQAIEVSKSNLSLATSVIEDSSASAVVRHRTRKSDLTENVNVRYVHALVVLPCFR